MMYFSIVPILAYEQIKIDTLVPIELLWGNVYDLWTSYPHILHMSILSSFWDQFIKSVEKDQKKYPAQEYDRFFLLK